MLHISHVHVRTSCLCLLFLSSLSEQNWRTRWFVLYKNELSYYKSREEKVALKTINLTDVMDVMADDSQGKQNCFK